MSEQKSTGNETRSNKANFALPRKRSSTYYGEWPECLQDQEGKLASEKKTLARTSRHLKGRLEIKAKNGPLRMGNV